MDREQLKKDLQDLLDKNKKQTATIPDGSLVKVLLYNVDYTKAGMTRAAAEGRSPSLLDGITLKYLVTEYYPLDDQGQIKKKVETVKVEVDSNGNKVIKFPADIVNPDGTISFAPIEVFEYFTPKMVSSPYNPGGQFVEPQEEMTALLMYNASWAQRYQRVMEELDLAKVVLACGLGDKMNLTLEGYPQISYETFNQKFGLQKPDKILFPIIPAYRYVVREFAKEELGPDKKPIPGAKGNIKIKLRGSRFDPKTGKRIADLDTIPTEYWDSDTVGLIIQALIERTELKGEDKPPF